MTHLKTGDIAPPFTAYDQDGNKTSLNDFRGHKVILYFYPKANTPGCTQNHVICVTITTFF